MSKFSRWILGIVFLASPLWVGCSDRAREEPSPKSPTLQTTKSQPSNFVANHSIRFDMTLGAQGLGLTYRNGQSSRYFSIIETLGGGVGIIDFDRDGWQDVFLSGGGYWTSRTTVTGSSHGLCWNRGSLLFQQVAVPASLADDRNYSFGVSIVDFDQDGYSDIHVTGLQAHHLYRNQGDGSFEDVTDIYFPNNAGWTSASAWADFNRDGMPDVYISHYIEWSPDTEPVCMASHGERDVCGPNEFQGQADQLFLQRGDGLFVEASDRIEVESAGRGLGVAAGDWDRDGHVDIYVANDANPNFYFKNSGDSKFVEAGFSSGTSLGSNSFPDGSMGIGIGDCDGNLHPDFLVTNFDGQYMELYANQGNGYFRLATRPAGLMALGNGTVGWGVVWSDVDCDGDEDVMFVTGHPSYGTAHRKSEQLPVFLENDSGKRLLSIGSLVGEFFKKASQGRGLAFADLDWDGDEEAVASLIEEPSQLLVNQSDRKGHYLQFELIGTESNRDAIGSYLLCHANEKSWVRHRFGGGSYASSSSPVLHVGLGLISKVDRVEIHWPSGNISSLVDVQVDQRIQVIEPTEPVR